MQHIFILCDSLSEYCVRYSFIHFKTDILCDNIVKIQVELSTLYDSLCKLNTVNYWCSETHNQLLYIETKLIFSSDYSSHTYK